MKATQVPQAGSIFAGQYRVDGILGEGGMGVVLRAAQLQTGRPVAIKMLTAEAAGDAETVARFRREAQIVSAIRNAHVVSVLDFGATDDGPQFIAMELLEGSDLASLVEARGPLPTEEAVALFLQASAGVAAAHAKGLIHRDLKPANLFLARREGLAPIVKVLDFGLSKSLAAGAVRLTQASITLGTPMYMAPEQILSANDVDARCDQHALAMILFELLTGQAPYAYASPAMLAVAIATHPPPSVRKLRADVPEALDLALRKAMAKRPSERFADLGQLARAVAPFAPTGASLFAAMIEGAVAPARAPELEAAPTVQMAVPASLLPDAYVRRPARTTRMAPEPAPAAMPAVAAPVARAPQGPRPRPRELRVKQTAILAGGVVLGVALVGTITFAIVTIANAPTPSPPEASSPFSAPPDAQASGGPEAERQRQVPSTQTSSPAHAISRERSHSPPR